MDTFTPSAAHPLAGVIEDREWIEFSICRGRLDLFFEPYRELGPQRAVREGNAKALCAQCPVQLACRDAGRRNHESGIWGGETEEERVVAGFPIRTVTRATLAAAHRASTTPSASTASPGRRSPVADHDVA